MQQVSSPNCGPRRDGLTPSIIVIHYTAMQSAEAAIKRLCDPSAEVSAHYVIARTGEVTQLVPEVLRAWHAGAGEWRGQTDINSRSIGIELDNAGTHPFPEPQMAALETLLAGIMKRWAIRPCDVIGHSDMAPGRKGDPGPRFDWTRLAKAQLAAPTQMSPSGDPDATAFRAIVNAAGFTAAVDDQSLLEAFRLRHCPSASGPLNAQDMKIAAGCASARAT